VPETGIQLIDVVNAFDQLQLEDRATGAGRIDPEILQAVLAPNIDFLNLKAGTYNPGAVSINGVSAVVDDVTDFAGAVSFGETPRLEQNRYYPLLQVSLSGGAVTPIEVRIKYGVGGITHTLYSREIANPGVAYMGPFFLPAGVELVVSNIPAGGAGDQMLVRAFGVMGRTGESFPLMPAVTSTET